MHEGKRWLAAGICLLALMRSMPLAAQEPEGIYRGVYDKQPVTASLNKLELSLTGMLSIGGVQYMMLADRTDRGYAGQLTQLDTGKVQEVELSMKQGRLQMRITGGIKPMQFVLDKAQE